MIFSDCIVKWGVSVMDFIHQIKTEKFQDNQIVLRFGEPINARSAVTRLILALMLVDRSKNYPTKQLLNYQIDMLYGTSLQANAFNIGYLHVVELSFKFLKDSLVKVTNYQKALSFLADLLYEPAFTKASFQEVKDQVLEMLLRQTDNPNQYNLVESLKIAGENYPLGINNLGSQDLIAAITLEEVESAYQKLISENRFDILLLGEIPDLITNQAKKLFTFPKINVPQSYYNFNSNEAKLITLNRDVKQTYLTLIYNTDISRDSEHYFDLLVANAIFGQFSTSLLFQEVREKRSLCYAIRSIVLANDGVILVNAGIKQDATELVINLISDILKQISEQSYPEALLEVSKKMLINQLLAGEDRSLALINRHYLSLLTNRVEALETMIEKIKQVSFQDVSLVAKNLILNTTVVLKEQAND